MKIGDAIKTMRGWAKIEIGSTRLRPFSDARKHFAEIFKAIADDEPCMYQITARFPPRQVGKAESAPASEE